MIRYQVTTYIKHPRQTSWETLPVPQRSQPQGKTPERKDVFIDSDDRH